MNAQLRMAYPLLIVVSACGTLAGVDSRYLKTSEVDASLDGKATNAAGGDAPTEGSDVAEAGMAADAADVEASDDASPDQPEAEASLSTEAGDDAASEGSPDVGVDGAPTPSGIQTSHLRLWLSADVGVTCTPQGPDSGGIGRVTAWADKAGHGDDATLQHGQLGPQCSVPGHAVNGVALPYFSAPHNGNVIDETLDVDLSFLVGTDYTIFVAERRWADYAGGVYNGLEEIIGTTMPAAVEAQNPTSCSQVAANLVLDFGYRYGDSLPNIVLDQWCDNPINAPVAPVPATPPAPLTVDTALFDRSRGREVWANGIALVSNAATRPLAYASGGALGRALYLTTLSGNDTRFRGDIAEVVVYDAALENADRAKVESYLKRHWAS
jgi:hypothetical protein